MLALFRVSLATSKMATQDCKNVNSLSTVEKSDVLVDSNDFRVDVGKQRNANENLINEPRSGIANAFSNEIFSPNVATNLFRSDNVS